MEGFLVTLFVAWIAFVGFLAFSSSSATTQALKTQCSNTASTIKSTQFTFDESNSRCSIVTVDGKLVSF